MSEQNQEIKSPQTEDGSGAGNGTKNGVSGLAVAGLVVGIIAIIGSWVPLLNFLSVWCAIIAIGLCIPGFIITRKGKKGGKGLAIAGLVLGILTIILVVVMYGSAAAISDDTTSDKSSKESTKTEEKATSKKDEEYSFSDGVLKTPEYTIEITDHKVIPAGKKGNEYGDKDVIAFWYKVTNISDDSLDPTTSWMGVFNAVQDNDPNAVNELEVGMLPDDKFTESQLEKIKIGGTVENAVAYEIDDNKTPVTLKAGDILGIDEYGTQTYKLK